VPVVVSGLSTVATDVALELFLTAGALSSLRVTLTNPLGTVVEVSPRGAPGDELFRYGAGATVTGFPADEPANGTWTLTVDDDAGDTDVTILDLALRIGSTDD